MTPNAPPLIFEADGEYRGLEAELAHELAGDLGRQVEFVPMAWDELIPAVREGRVDILMTAMSVTRARTQLVHFGDPYLSVGQMALIRRRDARWYETYPGIILTKRRVGVEHGTTGDLLVQEQFHYAQRVAFNSPEDGAKALIKGEIDLFIQDSPMMNWYASVYEGDGLVPVPKLLSREFLSWAVARENTTLLGNINRFIQAKKDDGSLQQAIERWMPSE
jgi:polar amino acid transport system substrate-binding protein